MFEFTGERVLPGQVEADLWNEHFARYLFAARLARGKRVLDLGCGAGYGAAELARVAQWVTGVDIAAEAIAYAQLHYRLPNLEYLESPCEAVAKPDASFDLVVAFEVMEHLPDANALLAEGRRLLAPGGQLVISTPNRLYYERQRLKAGPNPYHAREYDQDEFLDLLRGHFSHVSLFFQNHAPALVFAPAESGSHPPLVRMEPAADTATPHFFLAVCAQAPQTGSPTFLYLPSTGNVLFEREEHIDKLEALLADAVEQRAAATAKLESLHQELAQATEWAQTRDRDLAETQAERDRAVAWANHCDAQAAQAAAALEAKEQERLQAIKWAKQRDADFQEKVDDLRLVLAELEQLREQADRLTELAAAAEQRARHLSEERAMVAQSRWLRLGRALGVGPSL